MQKLCITKFMHYYVMHYDQLYCIKFLGLGTTRMLRVQIGIVPHCRLLSTNRETGRPDEFLFHELREAAKASLASAECGYVITVPEIQLGAAAQLSQYGT